MIPGLGARFAVFATRSASPPASHLTVRFGPPSNGRALEAPAVSLPANPPEVTFPPLPSVGESFGSGFMEFGRAAGGGTAGGMELLPGSTLATHPFWNGGLTGGFNAVVRIEGDPDTVFDAYQGRSAALTNEPGGDAESYRVGDTRIRVASFDSAGGPKIHLTMAATKNRDSWLLIEVGND